MPVGYGPAQKQAMLSPNAPDAIALDAGTPATSRRLLETRAVTHASSLSPATSLCPRDIDPATLQP